MTRKLLKQITENLILIEGWVRDGVDEQEIIHRLGVADEVFQTMKSKNKALSALLTHTAQQTIYRVENALLKRALGYETTERKAEYTDGKEKITETTKFVPPDLSAQTYWLKNRASAKWRDKPTEVEDTGGIRVTLDDTLSEYAE